jgi:hypothetical protein
MSRVDDAISISFGLPATDQSQVTAVAEGGVTA